VPRWSLTGAQWRLELQSGASAAGAHLKGLTASRAQAMPICGGGNETGPEPV
jgi:hypothetical protein